jgi:hypothetical protein
MTTGLWDEIRTLDILNAKHSDNHPSVTYGKCEVCADPVCVQGAVLITMELTIIQLQTLRLMSLNVNVNGA